MAAADVMRPSGTRMDLLNRLQGSCHDNDWRQPAVFQASRRLSRGRVCLSGPAELSRRSGFCRGLRSGTAVATVSA